MKKMKLLNTKFGGVGFSYGCGPMDEAPVVEIKVETEGNVEYYLYSEMDGMPSVFSSNESLFDSFVKSDDSEETRKKMDEAFIEGTETYLQLFLSVDCDILPAIRYLAYVVHAEEEGKKFAKKVKNSYLDELTFPNASTLE